MWYEDSKIQHFVVKNLSAKFMKKGVAIKIPLCYNNFCPLERGHGSQAVSGFPKKDLEKTSKNF